MKSIEGMSIKKRLSLWFQPELHQANWIELFFLALEVGGYVLIILISFFLKEGIVEEEERKIFILGWVIVPTCAILSVPFFLWIQKKYLAKVRKALSVLLIVNALLFTCLITGFNLFQHQTASLLLNFQPWVSKYFISGIGETPTSININQRARRYGW